MDHRTIRITEVDPALRIIKGRDEYNQLVSVTQQFLQPLIVVPAIGEQ